MNKDGFTLVELLAVIAILAILIIIALPNMIGLFNNARKNSFTNEAREIVNQAEHKWMSDTMFSPEAKVYSRSNLEMNGRSDIDFCATVDKNGKVTEFKVSDGIYQYQYSGSGLNKEDIQNVTKISEINNSEVISISCEEPSNYLYYYGGTFISLNSTIPSGVTTYNTYQDLVNELGFNFFIRLKMNNNIVKEIQAGFLLGGTDYYIKAGDSSDFERIKSELSSIFGSTKCTTGNAYGHDHMMCDDPDSPSSTSGFHMHVYIGDNGVFQYGDSFEDGAMCDISPTSGRCA